jgi:peptidoglycan lytic transglycosylase F
MKYLISVLLLIFIACSNPSSTDEKTNTVNSVNEKSVIKKDFSEIKQEGKLRVAMIHSAADYFFYKGEPMGYEYDLINQFADLHHLELEILLFNSFGEVFESLNKGKVDMIGVGLTILKERKKKVQFTDKLYQTHQVLVQQLPEGWKKIKPHIIEKKMLRDVTEIGGKDVVVLNSSSFLDRLINLENEIGENINIIEASDTVSMGELIEGVSKGNIKYTVADVDFARLGKLYFKNIDIETPLSLKQNVAFSVRKNAPKLLEKLNTWIASIQRSGIENIIYQKYYVNERAIKSRFNSPYLLISRGKISPYDELIKKYTDTINWDWRMLAAMIYRESKFNEKCTSWVGAKGLMQLMPKTAKHYGVENIFDPEQNIKGGVRFIQWLENYWHKNLSDKADLNKFVLASYNVGHNHVRDAMRLADKYELNPEKWSDVAYYLVRKSKAKYYHDPVVRFGYCRGIEPVQYVDDIHLMYTRYKDMIE